MQFGTAPTIHPRSVPGLSSSLNAGRPKSRRANAASAIGAGVFVDATASCCALDGGVDQIDDVGRVRLVFGEGDLASLYGRACDVAHTDITLSLPVSV